MKLASAHLYLTSSSCVWPLPLQMITPSEINAAFRRITPLQNSAVNAAPTPPSISTSPPHTHTQHWTSLHTTKLHLGGKNCKPFSKRWLYFYSTLDQFIQRAPCLSLHRDHQKALPLYALATALQAASPLPGNWVSGCSRIMSLALSSLRDKINKKRRKKTIRSDPFFERASAVVAGVREWERLCALVCVRWKGRVTEAEKFVFGYSLTCTEERKSVHICFPPRVLWG